MRHDMNPDPIRRRLVFD